MSSLVKTKRQANFKDFKRFGAFKGLVEQKNFVFNSFVCQLATKPQEHKNSSNKLLFFNFLLLRQPRACTNTSLCINFRLISKIRTIGKMRYSLAKPYLKNDNAFLTFPWVFFIAILASFRQGYTVNLPIFFNYTKFNKKLLNTKN
jgi:hypothetical protein